MIIRPLREKQYNTLCSVLESEARTEPYDASYTVDMSVSGVQYALRVQPVHFRKIAALQAVRITRDESGVSYELVTKECVLSSLLELLVYQAAG